MKATIKIQPHITMGDPLSPQVLASPPLNKPTSNTAMLYYGLAIIGTAVIVLTLYNLVVIRCNSRVTNRQANQRVSRHPEPTMSRSDHVNYVYSFKYKKNADEGNEYECAVCLSVFEEGEQLKQLPNCKHYFHAACIDMWLYSHFDCPLCRTSVEPTEHSGQGLLGHGALP